MEYLEEGSVFGGPLQEVKVIEQDECCVDLEGRFEVFEELAEIAEVSLFGEFAVQECRVLECGVEFVVQVERSKG